MIIYGIFIPRRPIIAGALAVPIGLSIVRADLGQWVLPPALLAVLTCSLWWAVPMLVGALYGAVVGITTGYAFYDDAERHGDAISVLSSIFAMLGVGMSVWLIKYL